MFHIETKIDDDRKFEKFIDSLGPDTRRQFDQFNDKSAWEAMIGEWNNSGRHKFFGILDDEIIAYGFLQRLARKYNIVTLGMVMSDRHHGHGYGKQMYKYVVDWGLERYTKIWSAVYEDNDRVLHIHKSLGFELEGIFVDELNDKRSIYSVAKFRDHWTSRVDKRLALVEKWNKV